MNQFDICLNNSKSKREVPYLLNLQSNPMDVLPTIIVAPIRKSSHCSNQKISRLHITMKVNDSEYIAFISEMAAIPVQLPGKIIDNASIHRQEIINAVDLLFTGF